MPYGIKKYLPKPFAWLLMGHGFQAKKGEGGDLLQNRGKDHTNDEYQKAFDSMSNSLKTEETEEVLAEANDMRVIAKLGLSEAMEEFAKEGSIFTVQGVYFYKCEQISRFNAVARQALQRKLATQSAGPEIEFSELATVSMLKKENGRSLKVRLLVSCAVA
eukprot:30294-Pelagococcus_subviridis.AAC.45